MDTDDFGGSFGCGFAVLRPVTGEENASNNSFAFGTLNVGFFFCPSASDVEDEDEDERATCGLDRKSKSANTSDPRVGWMGLPLVLMLLDRGRLLGVYESYR